MISRGKYYALTSSLEIFIQLPGRKMYVNVQALQVSKYTYNFKIKADPTPPNITYVVSFLSLLFLEVIKWSDFYLFDLASPFLRVKCIAYA